MDAIGFHFQTPERRRYVSAGCLDMTSPRLLHSLRETGESLHAVSVVFCSACYFNIELIKIRTQRNQR